MLQTLSNKGTINVVRTVRSLHIGFKNPIIVASEDLVTVDLGTPNLGTVWDITFLSLLFNGATYKNNIPPTEGVAQFIFRTELFIANIMQFQEAISESTKKDTIEHHFTIIGLQNLPQTVRVYGGQQITLKIILALDPESVIMADTKTGIGNFTMGYNLLDSHL